MNIPLVLGACVPNDSFVQSPSCNLCAPITLTSDKVVFRTSENLFKNSSLILISTYCYSDRSTSVSESESTASGVSTDDKYNRNHP